MIPETVDDLETMYRERLRHFCFVPARSEFARLAKRGGISKQRFDRWADYKQWYVDAKGVQR